MTVVTKRFLFLLVFLSLLAAVLMAGRALAGDQAPHMPAGPPALPAEAAPEAGKPLLERYVRVVRQHDGEDVSDSFG